MAEPERQRTEVELEGRRSPTEPEGRGVDRGVQSRCGGREMTDQGGARGTRELEAIVEPLGHRTEAESEPRRLKAESRWRSADQRRAHATDGELRVSREADEIQRRWC